ncbi:c-type cytochrome [Pontibacter rugosus]|uniref:C-type cytochrome n=1 Tax=Pontibacter rugosus TaxID=1745966 RepID=A0ABW3SRP5_9BACT
MKIKHALTILSSCAILASCGGNNETEGEQYYNQEQREAAAEGGDSPVDQTKVGADAGVNEMNEGEQLNAEGANYDKGAKLIAMSDCLSCHNEEQRIVGPSYKEVAAKYEFNDKNVDYLAGKIIQGGAGVWGQVPMTPHPDLSREDAREMAKYILAVHKK